MNGDRGTSRLERRSASIDLPADLSPLISTL